MFGCQIQSAAVFPRRFAIQGGGGISAGQQKMSVRIVRIDRDGVFEAVYGLFKSVLLFQHPAQVNDGGQKIRRDAHRLAQQPFGVVIALCRRGDHGQHAQGIDIPGVVVQHLSVQLLRVLDAAFLMMFGGQGQLFAFRREFKRGLEGRVGFLAPASGRQSLAQVEVGRVQFGVQPRRFLQHLDGFLVTLLFQQRIAQVFMGLGEGRRQGDSLLQHLFRLVQSPPLDQHGAQQARHVDILRVAFHRLPT